MKTNPILDEIRQTIPPEMKLRMEISVAIANRIYDILHEKGLSQKDFARMMGKTETEVSRWLSGTYNCVKQLPFSPLHNLDFHIVPSLPFAPTDADK